MKLGKIFLLVGVMLTTLSLTGCRRNTNEVWEDSQSAGRHVNRGLRALGGKHGSSRQVRSRDQFMPPFEQSTYSGNQGADFVPLADQENFGEVSVVERMAPQPRENPGDPGSSIPGIDSFRDPSTIPGLAGIFQNVHFEMNSNLVKGNENLQIVHNVAEYMQRNTNTYIFVEGHCCEKGPESYNLALGSRRSNAVRNLLISEGVNPDHVFTISYGKERPLVFEHHEEAWSRNRRVEFKVYQR